MTTADYQRGGTQRSAYGPEDVVDVPCPLCGNSEGERLATEFGSIEVRRCATPDCELIYTSPRLAEPEKVYWGDYERYVEEARLIFTDEAAHHRDPNYDEELDLIESFRPSKGRLLDVGCNMGMLLRRARARGWQVTGVEPSPPLHRIATEHLGLDVLNCFVEDIPAEWHGTFEVVALSDVFEHVTDPQGFLRSVAPLLTPDGLLYVKVPNARWTLLKQRLAAIARRAPDRSVWDSYEHVVHYTDDTLPRMLSEGGFETLSLSHARPVQVPVWHDYVGHYYQYPSPWTMDPLRHLGRSGFHAAAGMQRLARRGRPGSFSQSLVAVARRRP